eukprot:COSAG01_NODE_32607_length_578_cov_1.273486_1_plen_143_part_10
MVNIDFLNCGRLSEAQCYEIGEALIGNKVLKRLTFRSEHKLSAAGLREIANGLQRNKSLRTLEFLSSPKDTTRSHSNHLADACCFAIAEGLGKNRVLRSLALCGLQITEARTVTALATMVEGLSILETFQIEGEVGSRGTAEK